MSGEQHDEKAGEGKPIAPEAGGPHTEAGNQEAEAKTAKPPRRAPSRMSWRRVLPILNLIFTAAIASATVIYATVSYQQWDATLLSLNYTRQSVELAAEALKQAVKANRESAELTRRNLDFTRIGMEASQRAWITFVSYNPESFTLIAKQPLTIRLSFTNVGNSPAMRLAARSNWIIASGFPVSPPYGTSPAATPSRATLGPKAGSINASLDIPGQIDVVVEMVNRGSMTLYLYALVEYFDQFNTERRTKLCQYYIPPTPQRSSGQLAYCGMYNEVE